MPENQRANGWNEWSRYVLKELESLNDKYERLDAKLDETKLEVVQLQTKAGAWGAILGALGGGLISLIIAGTVGK